MTVLLTQSKFGALRVQERLTASGIDTQILSMIEVAAPKVTCSAHVSRQLTEGAFDWVVATSPNAALYFDTSLEQIVKNSTLRGPLFQVAVVGDETAMAVLAERQPDLIASDGTSKSLIADLIGVGVRGARILLALGDSAPHGSVSALEAAGATVTRVDAYRSAPIDFATHQIAALAEAISQCDLIAAASPSAINNLDRTFFEYVDGMAQVVSMGPSTTAAVKRSRLTLAAEADYPTLDSFVETLLENCR